MFRLIPVRQSRTADIGKCEPAVQSLGFIERMGGWALQTHTSVFVFAPYAFSTLVLSDSHHLGDTHAVHIGIKAS